MTPSDAFGADYEVHLLKEAVTALEARVLEERGREELQQEIAILTVLEARLYDVLYAVRPRSEKAA